VLQESVNFNETDGEAEGIAWVAVNVSNFGWVSFFCAHLAGDESASGKNITIVGGGLGANATVGDVNQKQAEELVKYVQDKDALLKKQYPKAEILTVVAGDFNFGPAIGDLQAQFPDSLALIPSEWRNAYLDKDIGRNSSSGNESASAPQCSLCQDNALLGGGLNGDFLLDHIFWVGAGFCELDSKLFNETSIGAASNSSEDNNGPRQVDLGQQQDLPISSRKGLWAKFCKSGANASASASASASESQSASSRQEEAVASSDANNMAVIFYLVSALIALLSWA